MKILWIVLAAIGGLLLLILLLLLLGKAKIRITCQKKVRVVASILGIRFTLISDKEKKDKPEKDLSRCHNPDAVLRKELRRRRKEAQKVLKKKKKAEKKAAKRAKKKQEKKRLAASQPTPNLQENLAMITALVKQLYAETNGQIKARVHKMHLYIGSDDAAKTAIAYAMALQGASYLLTFIHNHFMKLERDPGDMKVVADFLSGKCHADIDIVFSIRLSRALGIALRMYGAYNLEKENAQMKAYERRMEEKKRKQEKSVA